MNSDSCFVEEAFSQKKVKEESESDYYCPAPDQLPSWSWLGSSAEDSVKDSLFEIVYLIASISYLHLVIYF